MSSLFRERCIRSAINPAEIEKNMRQLRDSSREIGGDILGGQFTLWISGSSAVYLHGSIKTLDTGSEIVFYLQPAFAIICWGVLAPIVSVATFAFFDSDNLFGFVARQISLLVPQTPGFPILQRILISSGPMFLLLGNIFYLFSQSFRLEEFIIKLLE